ncbi:alkaline phosphatase family protein [Aestuariibacter sp. A3R04]|uniref:alkaline phosphatase family protein n=1 Tax=Aestuariibacter sp. A3R04 TaxID=2841571 RepID=UPI001C087654|nr:alkaline phosphatase family protein [Aestuariibacter sp. A3R04]MBU3021975.1 alkaline phosphatase family protein [Aestuariibacter sp. A3R04]
MSLLPLIIAGPLLRHTDNNGFTVWCVSTEACTPSLTLNGERITTSVHTVCIGKKAFVYLLTATPESGLSAGERYSYDLTFSATDQQSRWDREKAEFCYPDENAFSFYWQPTLNNVLHGSCRKPHHPETDALTRVDKLIAEELNGGLTRPDILLLTGDQVYSDDVAGPTLQAIQKVISLLELHPEPLEGAIIDHSSALADHPLNYYQRDRILPSIATNTALSKLFFGAKQKPVFTSVNAKNHLISLAEILAMYLLVWSPSLWRCIRLSVDEVPDEYKQQFEREQTVIQKFVETLPRIRRALAHIPVYMIFDDHDVTDDWNLTRGWEQEVYGHPLSRRMVGNALVGYWLCQGWGNQPDKFIHIEEQARTVFTSEGLVEQDTFISTLFDFEEWHYSLNTSPPVYVMDTRTRRWRSESSLNKPSGLMDWEALCEFQQALIGQHAVIVVSAAPIYGVKMIEAIQKVFTFFGKALTVDAENWMAHKGTANVILNIFRHYKTPPEFIILSGDVHYSFVYDVRLRFRRNSPHITQFTCSGIKNTFPPGLLKWLERLNRWFYGHKSPLNVFTRRRNMAVRSRPPNGRGRKALLNCSAIGQLVLRENDTTVTCRALCGNGDTVEFPPREEDKKGDE